jgi:hypothetical protein
MRDDPEAEVSVHIPVALGAFALLRVPEPLKADLDVKRLRA